MARLAPRLIRPWKEEHNNNNELAVLYCQTMGCRGPQPFSCRHVGETSETWLQIARHSGVADQMDSCSGALTRILWSTDKVRAEPSQDRAYTKRFNKNTKLYRQNGWWSNYSPSPYRNLSWRKTDMNFEEKKEHVKKWLKIPTRRRKIWSRDKKKTNYDAVETSSKNLKVSQKSSTRSTSDSAVRHFPVRQFPICHCPQSCNFHSSKFSYPVQGLLHGSWALWA